MQLKNWFPGKFVFFLWPKFPPNDTTFPLLGKYIITVDTESSRTILIAATIATRKPIYSQALSFSLSFFCVLICRRVIYKTYKFSFIIAVVSSVAANLSSDNSCVFFLLSNLPFFLSTRLTSRWQDNRTPVLLGVCRQRRTKHECKAGRTNRVQLSRMSDWIVLNEKDRIMYDQLWWEESVCNWMWVCGVRALLSFCQISWLRRY